MHDRNTAIDIFLIKTFLKFFITCMFFVVITLMDSNTHGQDNSSNELQIQEVMNGIRTDANASWWGFNETDSTYALEAAIQSKATKIIVPNMGKPWIVESISLESDKEIIFEKGVSVIAKSGSFLEKTASLFKAVNKKNIILNGYDAEFIMRKQDYMQSPYEKAEWRNCITIQGCNNIQIYGLRLAESGGDGIYIGRGVGKDSASSSDNIHIEDVTCDSNYRQGITIISVSNLLIENCIFQNTDGTPPQGGIDFEPNHSDEVLENCVVKNCNVIKNSGNGIIIYLPVFNNDSKRVSINIEGCQIKGNKKYPIYISGKNKKGIGDPSGSIFVKNCNMDGEVKLQDAKMLNIQIE